jgi:hypothetical protein
MLRAKWTGLRLGAAAPQKTQSAQPLIWRALTTLNSSVAPSVADHLI